MFIRLKGTTGKVVHDLDEDVKNDWPSLMANLQTRLDTTSKSDLYTSELMARHKLSSESYYDLANSIRSLARKAYSTLPSNVWDELQKISF